VFEAVAVGIILGIITGLTPGIHVNTVAVLILSYSSLLSNYFSKEELAIIVFVNAIVHTFLDVIPAVFLGVPDEDTAIAILPMHELVLEGRGVEACFISAFSSFTAFLFSLPIFALFLTLKGLELGKLIPIVLIVVSIAVIMSERGEVFAGSLSVWRKRLYALIVFVISGLLGYSTLNNENLLLPLLTGLFASPILLTSAFSSSDLPKQDLSFTDPKVRDVLSGTIAGAFVSLFPGISSGVATVISSNHLKKPERIVTAISSSNTSNALLCFAVLFSMHKTRSGAVAVFKDLIGTQFDLAEFVALGVFSALIALLLTLALAVAFGRFVSSVKPSNLSKVVLIFLVLVIYKLTGAYGLFVFALSTLVGLLAVFLRVRRINCMGCIILPTVIFYLTSQL
jgi:putative membrane protein